MLYAFYGSDPARSGEKARSLLNSLKMKRPEAAYLEINEDNWNSSILGEHAGGQGLFSNKYLVFLNRLSEKEESLSNLLEWLPAVAESDNIFVLLEGKAKIELKKALEKNAARTIVTDLPEMKRRPPGDDFNIFALADALGAKDGLKAWTIFRQAIDKGQETESVIGTIFWQLKSMVLAREAKTANEAGLSPFVFSKSKRYAANYSREELNELLGQVIVLYHEGHRGAVDLESGVERWILSLSRAGS